MMKLVFLSTLLLQTFSSYGRSQSDWYRETTRKSKALSGLLRHDKRGRVNLQGGWANIPEVLKIMGFQHQDIMDVIRLNDGDKKRFELDDPTNPTKIRCAQGHTNGAVIDYKQIMNPSDVGIVVHGTYSKNKSGISQLGLLQTRDYVHWANVENSVKLPMSGWRGDADMFVILDKERFLREGNAMFLSANGVLLTTQVKPEYFVQQAGKKFFTNVEMHQFVKDCLSQKNLQAAPKALSALLPKKQEYSDHHPASSESQVDPAGRFGSYKAALQANPRSETQRYHPEPEKWSNDDPSSSSDWAQQGNVGNWEIAGKKGRRYGKPQNRQGGYAANSQGNL